MYNYWFGVAAAFFLFLVGSTQSCKRSSSNTSYQFTTISGETMGTYYQLTCRCPASYQIKNSTDSLLYRINNELNTYDSLSFISRINRAEAGKEITNLPEHFLVNLQRARYWHEQSNGFFDVSIMPMVNYWGFGYTSRDAVSVIDSQFVTEIKEVIGLDKWQVKPNGIQKSDDRQQLDFSAIAKGYAVDEVGRLLNSHGCTDILVDIGGEMTSYGLNKSGEPWVIGISRPDPEASLQDIQLLIKLDQKALASSGNYRNYHTVGNRKYGHTINPKSGYPYQDQLLAVSIISESCMDADAIATSCMAMGYDKAITFISNLPEVSACFLIGAPDGTIQSEYINGFIQYVIE